MTPDQMFQLGEATWPAARTFPVGPWVIRDGQGGGSRVSAATATSRVRAEERVAAEQAMQDLGQQPLFMVRQGQDDLDKMLADAGYQIKDPVAGLAGPCADITGSASLAALWPPSPGQIAIWAQGDIGPSRLAIMHRAGGPKTALLVRHDGQPAGTAYVACDGAAAMIHAVEVAVPFRRRGLGRALLAAAARWAEGQGARTLALFVTRDNHAARALYAASGLGPVTSYHYRIRPA
jgi:N-acetylglutamate synthase